MVWKPDDALNFRGREEAFHASQCAPVHVHALYTFCSAVYPHFAMCILVSRARVRVLIYDARALPFHTVMFGTSCRPRVTSLS